MLNSVQFMPFQVIANKKAINNTAQNNTTNIPIRDTMSFGNNPAKPLESLEELVAKKDGLKGYYEKAQAITKYIYGVIAQGSKYNTDRFQEPLNHVYYRVPADGSLGLKMGGSLPESLCTPLGEMQIGGSTVPHDIKKRMAHLTEKLGLVEIVPASYKKDYGPIGATYAITRDLEGNPMTQLTKESLSRPNSFPLFDSDASKKIDALTNEVCPERKFLSVRPELECVN